MDRAMIKKLSFWVCILALLLSCSLGRKKSEVVSQTAEVAKQTPQAGDVRVREIDGMEMVYVPAGEFEMGSDQQGSNGHPVHTVYLDGYWIDQHEVSNAQFSEFVKASGYQTDAEKGGWGWVSGEKTEASWQHPLGAESSLEGKENHPIVQVSWNDAAAYCKWAGGRLPTEAEWEKAARGGDGRTYPWGNHEPTCDAANFSDCVGGTVPVGSYSAGTSPYGVSDMAGNVSEWVADWFEDEYSLENVSNPIGPETGEARVMRGGSWMFGTDFFGINLVSAYSRVSAPSDNRNTDTGFRCSFLN